MAAAEEAAGWEEEATAEAAVKAMVVVVMVVAAVVTVAGGMAAVVVVAAGMAAVTVAEAGEESAVGPLGPGPAYRHQSHHRCRNRLWDRPRKDKRLQLGLLVLRGDAPIFLSFVGAPQR